MLEKVSKKQSPQGQGTPEQIKQGKEAMTPDKAELSLSREKGYGELSAEQRALLANCNLSIGQTRELGGLIEGYLRIIKGTIGDNRVQITFGPGPGWENLAEAKVDGESLPAEEALKLRRKYQAIAEFQTKEAANLSQSSADRTKVKTLRETITKLLS